MTAPNTLSVKAPSMLERAKEEIDAVIGSIHQRKSSRDESDKMGFKSEKHEDGKKKPNMMKKAKEEFKSLFQSKEKPQRHYQHNHPHHTDVKALNVFERAKEEIDTIHPKKNEADGSEEERAGFGCSLGKWLEKICAPWGDNKKD